jgi:protein phosphatase
MSEWEAYSHSVAGRRDSNEDEMLILSLGEDGFFHGVADGMGGFKGGDVASAIVLKYAKEYLTDRFARPVRADQLKKILRELYAGADAAVRKEQKNNPQLAGMGTTLACILAKGDKYVVGNIGDSRVYCFSSGELTQLTEDHTYVQDMIRKTGIKPDAGVLKHYGHVVTRSIEGSKDVPDLFPTDDQWFTLRDGDSFILCSDGLIIDKTADPVSVFAGLLVGTATLKEAAEGMVSYALNAGSSDNISVVLATWGNLQRRQLQTPEPEGEGSGVVGALKPGPPLWKKLLGSLSPAVIAIVALALLALVLAFALRSFGQPEGESDDALGANGLSVAQSEPSHAIGGVKRSPLVWQPFAGHRVGSARLSDGLSWSPYPSDDLMCYEVRFGGIGPKTFLEARCPLDTIEALQPKVPYRVTVVAILRDGRRISGASRILVFR